MRKTIFSIFFLFVIFVAAFFPTQEISAKSKVKLSATKKTITVGQQYKIRLKNAGKVTWETSKRSVVKIQKKGKNYIYVVGKKKGTATITATYKKKKYKCKITVNNKKIAESPTLNATNVTLYHIDDMHKEFITCDPSHLNQYQLEVTGMKKDVVSWKLIGADASYFRINDGLIQMWLGMPYGKGPAKATVQAMLEDGTMLTAEVTGYSEEHAYIDKLFENFKHTYITADMTEYQKMEKCAWYIQAMFDYEYYQSSWMHMAISGGGDCMASRYFMEQLARYIGLKAAACGNFECHGMTLVQADGKNYYVTTGFDGEKPRKYMINLMQDENFKNLCIKNGISPEYFGL